MPRARAAPGRLPATAQIARVVMRVAEPADASRDDNGVSSDAGESVARAATGAGAPLPADVRAQFEGSLGADLSDVRVHTGAASAEAADAVGAKAYTVGNDIHFNEGQYAPLDPFGIHLLAHEVAHTQQQAGGGAVPQCKLEVSTPGDAAELEADRAADAMVRGAPATVSPRAGAVMRGPNRLPDGYDLAHEVDRERAQEDLAKPDPKDIYQQPPINWDARAVEAPGPLDPGTWVMPAVTFAQTDPMFGGIASSALPYRRPDGGVANMGFGSKRPAWYSRWQADGQHALMCNFAFHDSYREAVADWNVIAPDICAFNTAAKDADAQGLHGIKSEAQFDAPAANKQGDNLDQYGDAQTVGLDGKKSMIPSLFKDGGTTAAVDTSAVKKGEVLDTALQGAIATAEENLTTSTLNLRSGLLAHAALKNNAKIALAGVDIVKDGKSQLEQDAAKADLVLAKARWGIAIDASSKVITGLIDMAVAVEKKESPSAVKAYVSTVATVAKAMSDVNFDNQIFAVDKKVLAIRDEILSKQRFVADTTVTNALLAIDADNAKLSTLRTDLLQKLRARKLAYDLSANAASDNAKANGASDTDAARINAAIKAIPVIESMVARIQRISLAINVPAYGAYSGKGFRSAGEPQDFILGVQHLKGYRSQFTAYEKKWQGRLTSLQALANGLYSKA